MKSLVRLLMVVAIFLSPPAFAVDLMKYEEGKQYQRAPEDILNNDVVKGLIEQAKKDKKVQVFEFFSYACAWCYKLDPAMEKWVEKAPKYIDFYRVPVEFQPAWGALTKSYYTAVQLNAGNKIHHALFDDIFNEKLTSSSEEILQQFFVENGIKAEDFKKTFGSTAVADKQKWANGVAKAFRITAIPAVIVQGPEGTFITSIRLAGGEQQVVMVVDYLTKMQKKASEKKGK